jgi:hypothetical protein
VAEGLAGKGAAYVAPAHGDAVGQRAHDHAEQFLVAGRAAHHEDLAEVGPERPDGAPEVGGQDRDLEPEPDRPPFARRVAAVERKQAAWPVDGEHPGGGCGRAGGEETAAPVLGLEPLAAVHPDAGAALHPVGRRTGYAERLRHRGGEQVARARGHHAVRGPDHVDGARSQVDDECVGAGARRGEGPGPGRGRLGDQAAKGRAGQFTRQAGRGQPAQGRDEQRPARAAVPGGRRLGGGG